MSKLVINGAKELSGYIDVSGSKNAALPIIFSTVITCGSSVLYGVPDIGDVRVALSLIKDMGAHVVREGDALYINTEKLVYSVHNEHLVSSIRASSYLLGADLARFGRARLQNFGGCNFEFRPIDMHIYAMRALGAVEDGKFMRAEKLLGGDIRFDKKSVGATVNAIIMSATAEGVSRIFGYAREPHVCSLIDFLVSCGADITLYDEYIEIKGRELHGGCARIIPDMIEAGTYLVISALSGGKVSVRGADTSHIASLISLLRSSGFFVGERGDGIYADGVPVKPINVITSPYPGFPTDLQPQMAPLLAFFCGGSICERVWHSRFAYLEELKKFGIESERFGDTAHILPSKIQSASVNAVDLRAGAAMVICALFARGESVVNSSELVGRGYEKFVEKLSSIGADIIEIES